METAISHHHKNNRHHPEYHDNGIFDMNLIDLLEMVCDWMASVKRHSDGDIYQSIEINKKRHKIPESLVSILKNTVEVLNENYK